MVNLFLSLVLIIGVPLLLHWILDHPNEPDFEKLREYMEEVDYE